MGRVQFAKLTQSKTLSVKIQDVLVSSLTTLQGLDASGNGTIYTVQSGKIVKLLWLKADRSGGTATIDELYIEDSSGNTLNLMNIALFRRSMKIIGINQL